MLPGGRFHRQVWSEEAAKKTLTIQVQHPKIIINTSKIHDYYKKILGLNLLEDFTCKATIFSDSLSRKELHFPIACSRASGSSFLRASRALSISSRRRKSWIFYFNFGHVFSKIYSSSSLINLWWEILFFSIPPQG